MKIRTGETTANVTVEDIVVSGRQMTPSKFQKITNRHTRTIRGVEKVDTDAIAFDIFDYKIVSWEGDITDLAGKELACTTESKKLIWEYDQQFAADILTAIDEALQRREDIAEKNS